MKRRRDGYVYRQIAAELRERFRQGCYENDLLPPEKELWEEFDVGRDTLRKALGVLVMEGRIVKDQGKRTRIVRPGPPSVVPRAPGATISARPPTEEEQDEYEIPEGVWMLVVGDRAYPADRNVYHDPG